MDVMARKGRACFHINLGVICVHSMPADAITKGVHVQSEEGGAED